VEGDTPSSLSWTVDDDRIVYIATGELGFGGLGVHVVDPSGKDDIELTPEAADLQLRFDYAAVSPEGTRVAYVQRNRCANGGCSQDTERLLIMHLDGANVIELQIPPESGVSGLQWSPDGQRLLFGSIAGVVSVAAAPGSPAIVHSTGELNLEWSGAEVTWQPVFE